MAATGGEEYSGRTGPATQNSAPGPQTTDAQRARGEELRTTDSQSQGQYRCRRF